MNESEKDILLTVCIPTYNRAPYLTDAIKYILPYIIELNGKVELIISDNCSTDTTSEVLKKVPSKPWIKCVRNESNIGALKNGLRCISLAKGEYIWFVGDDDVIRPEGLSHLVDIISVEKDIDYFVVNAVTLFNTQRNELYDILNDDALLQKQVTKFKSLSDRHVSSFNEYIDPDFDPIFLGAMMCNVIKRKVWQNGLKGIDPDAPMGTVVGTYLVCNVLARNMVDKPSFYIGYPCCVAFWGHQEWTGYLPIIFAYTFYAVLDCYEENGVETWRIDRCRRYLHKKSAPAVYRLTLSKSLPGNQFFSFWTHLSRYWKQQELWIALLQLPVKYIGYKLKILS